MCSCLANLGADLVLVDHPSADFDKLSLEISQFRGNYTFMECDLSSISARNDLLSEIHQKFTRLTCLINNAAYIGSSNLDGWSVPFEKQTLEAWSAALEVNLTAPFHLSQSLAKLLANSENSSILNISSIYGFLGPDWSMYKDTSMSNPAAYAASKGGLIQLTRWLATTLAPSIRVNAIAPGGLFRNQPDPFVKRYEMRTPLGRLGSEEDLIGSVLYLTTKMGQYVTGQILAVDGGFSVW